MGDIFTENDESANAPDSFTLEDVATSIPARFAKIVQRYPDRLAIKMGPRSLTYGQLDRAATRIAHAIALERCQPGDAVALLFEPGIDAISAVMAVLKSAGVYVALDPSFPIDRLTAILRDSRAVLIVADGRTEAMARELAATQCSWLNIDAISECPDLPVHRSVSPNDLAVITYTSGSTGTPKGVAHTHRNLLSKGFAYSHHKGVTPEDRVSLLHSLGFAASHGNLLISLLNGAALLPLDVKSSGVPRLAEWLDEERISIAHLPVMAFRELAECRRTQNGLPNLRIIYLSGAPITKLDFEFYKDVFSAHSQLEIGMGSTETGHICLAMLDRSFTFPELGTPVGYPLPGKHVILIDDAGNEVGESETGEIAVRSTDLSSGYWRQPDLTAQKFRPVAGKPDERIYLTGDLGRMQPDGLLVHLGRKDFMVKIRGYRVDISEIENRLREHPNVTDAAVSDWEIDGEKSLAAYIVLKSDKTLEASELKAFLGEKLPDYMIPPTLHFLAALPLTNGKVDRGVLGSPSKCRPPQTTPYAAPVGELETKLTDIWSKVLGIEPIGVHDNFFDLGGHSLTASRVLSRISQYFQIALPMSALFRTPTVAGLAAIVAAHQDSTRDAAAMASILQQIEEISEDEARRKLAEHPLAGQSRID